MTEDEATRKAKADADTAMHDIRESVGAATDKELEDLRDFGIDAELNQRANEDADDAVIEAEQQARREPEAPLSPGE